MGEKKGNAASQGGKASPPRDNVTVKPQKKKSGLFGRIVRRFFLLLFTLILMLAVGLVLVMNAIFKGPSPAAQKVLTMSLLEPSATKWIPALFIGEEAVEEIRSSKGVELSSEVTDTSQVVINKDGLMAQGEDWSKYPDGIRIETYKGKTFNAHIMLMKDPSRVYLGISTKSGFSPSIPGRRPNEAIEDHGALAVINAGAFWDNGKIDPRVGATPEGLVYSEGACVWTTGAPPTGSGGFAGFNTDDILVVHRENLNKAQAEELNIRDGCCFGPALIINGEVNQEAYNSASGYNPRTAVGQRADGVVIFVCVDGRQAGSVGGTYADVIDILVEYGAVNACNMDGGSSSVMMYRDTQGLYGEPGAVQMINSYSLLQSEPRRMPDFWMVRPAN